MASDPWHHGTKRLIADLSSFHGSGRQHCGAQLGIVGQQVPEKLQGAKYVWAQMFALRKLCKLCIHQKYPKIIKNWVLLKDAARLWWKRSHSLYSKKRHNKQLEHTACSLKMVYSVLEGLGGCSKRYIQFILDMIVIGHELHPNEPLKRCTPTMTAG